MSGYRPSRGHIPWPVSPGPTPRKAPPPLPPVHIRAANGSELNVPIGAAVPLLVTGGAELIEPSPDADTRAALDAALDRYRQIPAVRRSLNPDAE